MARLTTKEGYEKACRIIQKYYMEQTQQDECVQFYVTFMQPMKQHIERAVAYNKDSESSVLNLYGVINCTDLEPDFIEALNQLIDTQRKPTKKRF